LPARECGNVSADRETASRIIVFRTYGSGEPGLPRHSKPYHFPELLARVRALLRRGPALTYSQLSYKDLTMDTRARRVERRGRVIPLTTKEYTLLEYLRRRQGDVVGRSDIAEHVWDDSFDPMSNLIEVYISGYGARSTTTAW
jgi:hypothetical protein